MSVFANTFKNIRRSPYQAIALIAVLSVTIFAAQVFAILMQGMSTISSYFETQPQITAFFTDEISESTLKEYQQQLEAKEYVKEVSYISKDDALALYTEDNKDDPLMLEMVSADILPASLEVSAETIEDLNKVKSDVESLQGVEDIAMQQDVIDAISKWTHAIEVGGYSVVGFLAVTSALILIIVISMKISSKRSEIATMRLMGANSWYIRGPFIMEAAFYGAVSALIGCAIVLTGLNYFRPQITSFMQDIPVLPLPQDFLIYLIGGSVGGGALLGMISAFIASRRFYK